RQYADAVLSPLGADTPLQDVVEVHRLVGAMKTTDSKVDDCGRQVFTSVRWRGYVRRQRREIGLAQLPRRVRRGRRASHAPTRPRTPPGWCAPPGRFLLARSARPG